MNTLIINHVVPAIRMMTSLDTVMTARFDSRKEVLSINNEDEIFELSFIKKSAGILIVDETTDPDEIIDDLKVKLSAWFDSRIVHPDYVFLKGIGLIAIAENASLLDVLLGAQESLNTSVSGRVQNKIAIVTGGAQGYGKGIAEELYSQGANVVIADLNEETGQKEVDKLNSSKQTNQAFFVKTNVVSPESVENMVAATVKQFGGLDVIISDAGIIFDGGLNEMTPEVFTVMTDVNYKGYFLCAKYASEVMKIQSQFRGNYFADIIQINSKSGLKGSSRDFALSGGKFGGIGLTQSFALELMPYRIKVNAICPGDYFEEPIWSDPEKGFFAHYLKSGKIPGAKDIKDVKAFYEAQIPAGRGCTVNDIMKAIYYVMEQEYETGQALPVTGGQIMLK
jgi:NAD(P)-dependent dehydrogenase (short-subunit alcohol dehydrogenase family)